MYGVKLQRWKLATAYLSPVDNWHILVPLFNGCVNYQRLEWVIQQIFSWKMTGRVIFQLGLSTTLHRTFVFRISLGTSYFLHCYSHFIYSAISTLDLLSGDHVCSIECYTYLFTAGEGKIFIIPKLRVWMSALHFFCMNVTLLKEQKRSTEGCSKFKSPETRQVQERLVSTLEHMQVPKWDRTRCPEE